MRHTHLELSSQPYGCPLPPPFSPSIRAPQGTHSNTWKAVRVFDEESGRKYKLIVTCTSE